MANPVLIRIGLNIVIRLALTGSTSVNEMLDYEDISHLASAIQSIAVAIAVIVGGVWTVFTFNRLRLTKKAEAELAELQQKLSRTALLNINVTATSATLAAEDGYLISAQAIVENVGTRRTSLLFPADHRPFHAVLIRSEENGDLKLGSPIHTGIPYGDGTESFSQRSIVGPGARVTLPFVFRTKQPGLYMVSFSAIPSIEVHEELTQEGVQDPTKAQWTGRCYVLVGSDLPNSARFEPRRPSTAV